MWRNHWTIIISLQQDLIDEHERNYSDDESAHDFIDVFIKEMRNQAGNENSSFTSEFNWVFFQKEKFIKYSFQQRNNWLWPWSTYVTQDLRQPVIPLVIRIIYIIRSFNNSPFIAIRFCTALPVASSGSSDQDATRTGRRVWRFVAHLGVEISVRLPFRIINL